MTSPTQTKRRCLMCRSFIRRSHKVCCGRCGAVNVQARTTSLPNPHAAWKPVVTAQFAYRPWWEAASS